MIQESINAVSSAICRIEEFYKIVTRTPTNDEEEEKNIQLAYRLLHIGHLVWTVDYRLMKRFSRTVKFVFYMLMTLLSITGYLYYGVILLKGHVAFDIGECLTMGNSLSLHIFTFVCRPIYIAFFDDMITGTLDYTSAFKPRFNAIHFRCAKGIIFDRLIDENCSINIANIYKKENIVRISFLVPVVCILAGIILIIWSPLHYILKHADGFPTIQDYYTLFPLYNRIESPIIYWLITFLISFFGLYEVVVDFTAASNVSTILSAMKYNALVVSEKIHLLSLNFIYEYEKMLEVKEQGYHWDSTKNRLFTAFDEDLVQLLKQYEKFSRYARITETFMNIFLTLVISVTPLGMFSLVAHMIMVKTSVFQKLRYIFSLIFLVVGLFFVCSTAATFEDVGEIYRYAVYNLPWYYLPPKTRKVVNIFQCMVLDHPKFKILRVYPVNMSLFPRLWNSVYSYANILRTTTMH